jgi:hypothetical protein
MQISLQDLHPFVLRKLQVDWFERFARDHGIEFEPSHPADPTFLRATDFQVDMKEISHTPFIEFASNDPERAGLVQSLSLRALERVQAGDLGGFVWHSTRFAENAFRLEWRNPFGVLFQRLSNQTRIAGWHRLGQDILLKFSDDGSSEPDNGPQSIFTHKPSVEAYMRVEAPKVGYFSEFCASTLVEIIGAICTFALGRGVVAPPIASDADLALFSDLDQMRNDPLVPTLTRKGVGLDFLLAERLPGGTEYVEKLRTALLTFQEAFKVDHDAVACALYVVVADGLATPAAKWKHEKITDRFIRFYEEMIPDTLDAMAAHQDFEQIFEIRRGRRTGRALRRDLLNAIYTYRSGQLHHGVLPSLRDIMPNTRVREDMRRTFFCMFAEAAILSYMAAPRCSLVGSPGTVTASIRRLPAPGTSSKSRP